MRKWACRGVLADFGSVANYCSQNSKAPVLMVPPNVASLQTKQPGHLQAAVCLCFIVLSTCSLDDWIQQRHKALQTEPGK